MNFIGKAFVDIQEDKKNRTPKKKDDSFRGRLQCIKEKTFKKKRDRYSGPSNHPVLPNRSTEKTNEFFLKSGENYYPEEDAAKFTYDRDTNKWRVVQTKVRVAKKPFASGGMRFCYKGGEISLDGDVEPCVFKHFKNTNTNTPLKVFQEALTQAVARSYAVAFNRKLQDVSRRLSEIKRTHVLKTEASEEESRQHHDKITALSKKQEKLSVRINFIKVCVVFLPARGEHFYATMEPILPDPSRYIKHNDNFGRIQDKAEDRLETDIAQTFSYYTFIASKGYLIVCDIQGVDHQYTDPQIHCLDTNMFGAGNFGAIGIKKFLESFQFTELASLLRLPEINTENKSNEELTDSVEYRNLMKTLGTIDNLKTPEPSSPDKIFVVESNPAANKEGCLSMEVFDYNDSTLQIQPDMGSLIQNQQVLKLKSNAYNCSFFQN